LLFILFYKPFVRHYFAVNNSRASPNRQIPTTWMKTECRGNFSYEVLKFPLRIGFSPRKPVFESNVVVGISIINIIINNELRAI